MKLKKGHIVLLFLCAQFLCACSAQNDENTLLENQLTKIESYLNGKGYDYEVVNGVYRYIPNADRPDQENSPVVNKGDQIKITFAAYEFTGSENKLIYTNMPELIAFDTILNTKYWGKGPLEIELGDPTLVRGVNRGLEGCLVGDSVLLFFPSKLGYGKEKRGLVPGDTPQTWSIKINSVQ